MLCVLLGCAGKGVEDSADTDPADTDTDADADADSDADTDADTDLATATLNLTIVDSELLTPVIGASVSVGAEVDVSNANGEATVLLTENDYFEAVVLTPGFLDFHLLGWMNTVAYTESAYISKTTYIDGFLASLGQAAVDPSKGMIAFVFIDSATGYGITGVQVSLDVAHDPSFGVDDNGSASSSSRSISNGSLSFPNVPTGTAGMTLELPFAYTGCYLHDSVVGDFPASAEIYPNAITMIWAWCD